MQRACFAVVVACLGLGCGRSVGDFDGLDNDSSIDFDGELDTGAGGIETDPGVDSPPPPIDTIDFDTVPPDDDTGPPPIDDTGIVKDGGTVGEILCGSTSCNAKNQDCCVSLSSQKCVKRGTCSGGIPLSCSDSSVCASGQTCCLGVFTSAATCEKSSCVGFTLCAVAKECKSPLKCKALGLGYKACQ